MRGLHCLIFLAAAFTSIAQLRTTIVSSGDIANLKLDVFEGTLQWQEASTIDGEYNDIDGAIGSTYEYQINQLPVYIRGRITTDDCVILTEIIELLDASDALLWSDINTWDGTKPGDGDEVTIPEGKTIFLDENTADLAGLNILGTLEFLRTDDLILTADHIFIEDGGLLKIGTKAQPFTQKATINLNGTNTDNDANTRGINVLPGGILDIHGATPEVIWTKIAANVSSGDTDIELIEAVDWPVGSEVILAPTDYYEAGNRTSVTQKFKLLGVSDKTIKVDHPSQANVWGVLQYVSSTGVSLNSSDMITPPSEEVPTIIDERAEIGLLSRNVVIQAPNDDLWQNEGLGVHTMTMRGGTSRFEGVEFRRAGQAGHIQRYAYHQHMQNVTGNSNGDRVYVDTDLDNNQYVKKSAINSSMNRGLVLHGTWNVELSDNVIYDVKGHGIFLEDGSERKNTITRNLVLHVRDPELQNVLMAHESVELNDFGSSGIWHSNPDNDLAENVFGDCQTFGIWAAFSFQAWGLSNGVLNLDDPSVIDNPSRTAMGTFKDNITHSNRLGGIRLDDVQMDEEGNTTGHFYRPTNDGKLQEWPYANNVHFLVEGGIAYKNGGTGVWDRSSRSIARSIVNVDNAGRYFAGAGSAGLIEKCLVVSKSHNMNMNGTYRPLNTDCAAGRCNQLGTVAFASYHYGFEFDGNLIVGFNLDECEEGERCGTFDFSDLYIRAVEEGPTAFVRNNVLIDSHGGVKLYPPDPYDHFTLAPAVNAKVHGYEEGYFIYDDDFHASGLEVVQVEPVGKSGGVIAFDGKWSGIRGFVLDNQNEFYRDLWAIDVTKFEWSDGQLTELGNWFVDEAPYSGILLDQMRDAALNDNFIYTLDFPKNESPQEFAMLVDNLIDDDHTQVIGIEFDTGNPPSEVYINSWGNRTDYEEVGSLAEVINSTEGRVWWLDTENNRVWTALQGGDWEFYTNPEQATPEDRLYETVEFHLK